MEKLYFKENGKEVKIGDVVSFSTEGNDPSIGKITTTVATTITKSNIPILIGMGVLIKEDDNCYDVCMDINYYIEKIANRMNWNPKKIYNILINVDSVYPIASFNIILREIAVELDKKYADHISNSPEIYAIASINGTIGKVNKAKIKSYKNFAAFRNVEDAKIACKILSPILKEMYAND